MKPLRIAHLYPELLNLYADKGNIRTLQQRCQWRDIPVEITPIQLNDRLDLDMYDLLLLGGGSDREQELIGHTLQAKRADFKAAVEDGLPLLGICGGYQLLGAYYQLPDGTEVPGLSVLNLVTHAGSSRLIGNIMIESEACGSIVGFENHGGRTVHQHEPLGRVVTGYGNNGEDQMEGARYKNVLGTYMHGPLLPKNPKLADFILQMALDYAGINHVLEPLNDALEVLAHRAFQERRLGRPPTA